MRHPVEAFTALISDFRRYTRLQLTWLDVRQILAQAESLRDQYLTCHTNTDDSDCADRLRALALLPEYHAIADELLQAAHELDGRLQVLTQESECV